MRKEYLIKGLCCANCVQKIENSIKKLESINFVEINFLNSSLVIELKKDSVVKNIKKIIEEIIHKYEADAIIIEKEKIKKQNDYPRYNEFNKKSLIQLFIGIIIFIFALLIRDNFVLKFILFLISYIIFGVDIVFKALKNIFKGQVFDENFLMSIASIGAFFIKEYPEACGVMLFYKIGEYLQDYVVEKSKKSISELMDIRPDFANLRNGDEIKKISPNDVKVGDIIIVKVGEKIPLDGTIINGESFLDTEAITGEALPRKVKVNDFVISGSINKSALISIKVEKTFGESTVSKIIDLVENAATKKSKTENFITKFSRYYTPFVVAFAVLISIIPPLLIGGEWSQWINKGLIFLVISCPCALVISIPLGFFGGIGRASKQGIMIKGSNYLESLNNVDIVVFDKTGTLTKGIFEVQNIYTVNGTTSDEILEIVANAEFYSNHPIATSILKANKKEINKNNIENHKEISGYGINAKVFGKDVLVGNEKYMKNENIDFGKINFSEADNIGTKVYVAIDNKFAGCIIIADEIRIDSKKAIKELKKRGISKTVMLTGDNKISGEMVAKQLDIDEVYTELLPDQKVEKLELLEKQKKANAKLVFIGDGINDAPVLAMADIGIAMGGVGTDAAIESADIVFMTDEPYKLVEAIDIAKMTKKIVWQNIVFALGIKSIIMILGSFGIATMWEAVFADVGVCLLAIFNSLRILKSNNK
ncbi:MAG: cadmium-translocating P-type ATPase [Elusimicrobiota bacterium]|jgi:Cd2+/Zn2+-exporting ATPase|nr:cadmium-translocating P-type ATPase [Elusimicrobiota bacterium]